MFPLENMMMQLLRCVGTDIIVRIIIKTAYNRESRNSLNLQNDGIFLSHYGTLMQLQTME